MATTTAPREVETLTIDLFAPDDRSRENRRIHAATVMAAAIERFGLSDDELRRIFEAGLTERHCYNLIRDQTSGW